MLDFTVWFAITFWVYLETRSVLATGMVAGIFLVTTALTGIWFGSLIDHHRKKVVLQVSTAASLVLYAVSFAIYQLTPKAEFTDAGSVVLWVFIVLAMVGVIAGNVWGIALPTLVTVLIPAERRDKANGLVGSTMGVSMLVTSVISGLLVAAGDMFYVLLLAIGGDGCWPWRTWPGCGSTRAGLRRPARARAAWAGSTCEEPSDWSGGCRA